MFNKAKTIFSTEFGNNLIIAGMVFGIFGKESRTKPVNNKLDPHGSAVI